MAVSVKSKVGWGIGAPANVSDAEFKDVIHTPHLPLMSDEHKANVSANSLSKKSVSSNTSSSHSFEPIKSKPHKTSSFVSCHETHPPLKFSVGGVEYSIYGGSCIKPVVHNMDVFIGLDGGMSRTDRQYPWTEGVEFLYPITDMQPPKNVESFKSMIHFIATSLIEGKKVFVGCIGGHGRTGVVFSALVKHMTGMADSTTYVRKNYCHKVVESHAQVEWLHTHFGITKVEATKGGGYSFNSSYPAKSASTYADPYNSPAKKHKGRKIACVASPKNIHMGNKVTQLPPET